MTAATPSSSPEETERASPGLTRQVARFISRTTLDDVPAHVRRLAARSILDGLGVAVVGGQSEAARLVQAEIAGYGFGEGEASVLGTGLRVPARFAAFANGLAVHAEDFDDTQLAAAGDRVYGLLTHPTAPVLPAALALAERGRRSGADLLLAYLIGVEVETKVAEAIQSRHYEDGFHTTGTVGTIGAAAAAARLLDLPEERVVAALGIGASQAAGLRENFGTMMKPFHAGRAAESGVLAATLAARGFTASPDILEAPRGFFRAAGGGYNGEAIEGRLGRPWTFERPGVSIKPYPSGSLSHPGMGAFADLVARRDLRPEQVARIVVGTNHHTTNALLHHRPQTGLQAKFSLEFCLAILLLRRRAGLAEFTDEVVRRRDVQATMERVSVAVDPAADAAGYDAMPTHLRVELRDGRVLEASASYGRGSPANPMPDRELVEKFAGCLEFAGLGRDVAEAIAQRVLRLEEARSVADILPPRPPSGGVAEKA